MKQRLRNALLPMVFGLGLVFLPAGLCSAEVVEGQAPIIDGNVSKAQYEARQDAMRTFVENKVGVQVESSTEVDMGAIVSDHILTKSDGYVSVKRVVKQQRVGNIYIVQLDLDASPNMIETAKEDVQSKLESLSKESSRYGVSVAVIGYNETGGLKTLSDTNRYVKSILADQGFWVRGGDAVLKYMGQNQGIPDTDMTVAVRQIARKNRGTHENALLRGTLTTKDVRKDGNSYIATVHASFELIGLDDDTSNSFDGYFTAAASNYDKAVANAENDATREAVNTLGQKALKTVQREDQGGMHHIETVMVFQNLSGMAQAKSILAALNNAGNIEVVRYGMNDSSTLQVFAEATGYKSIGALQDFITGQFDCMPASDMGDSVGSSKMVFNF